MKVNFALPEVAFSSAYRPGFSTYPEGATFKEIYAVLAKHGSPGWISAEGVNVSPTSMPGEPTMETYLARMFNHGAVLVNVFSWGIGGEAMRDNFFRRATENPEALSAYAKFLRHTALVEAAPTGFSSAAFQDKMRRIQKELPGWVQASGKQAQAMPLTKKLEALIKERHWQDADKVADKLLALMKGESKEVKSPALPLMERLPSKIHRIQKELPAWIQKTGNTEEASALMKKLDEHLKAKDFEEAEKTADAILKLMGVNANCRPERSLRVTSHHERHGDDDQIQSTRVEDRGTSAGRRASSLACCVVRIVRRARPVSCREGWPGIGRCRRRRRP